MITLRRLHLRRVLRPHQFLLHHFSSSPSDVPPGKPESEPSLTSYFNEVRANLKREPPPQSRPQSPRKPLSFSKSPQTPPPSKGSYLDEIGRNLAEYRSRSAPPPPPSATKDNESAAFPNNSGTISPSGRSFDAIKGSLRHLRPESRNGSDQMHRNPSRDSLNPKPGQNYVLPSYWMNAGGDSKMRTGLLGIYNYSEMGAKLKSLRPEKKKGKWFSLQELNERLGKLREMEENESKPIVDGLSIKDLRETVIKLANSEEEKMRKKAMQRLEMLGQLETPAYMMLDPKDDLVEKYFHPDNMSSSEKLKLELKRVRDEFKMSESDCGSARVQVAQLTTKIHHLSSTLHKKDKHSRRGLLAMVQRRKKLLKYLRRSDWDSYCLVLSKLSLRDVTDIKSQN